MKDEVLLVLFMSVSLTSILSACYLHHLYKTATELYCRTECCTIADYKNCLNTDSVISLKAKDGEQWKID